MRILVASIAICAITGLSSCTKIAARDSIREGNSLYRDSRYEEAIDKYNEAEKLEPDGVTLYWNRACAAESIVLRLKDEDPETREKRKQFTDMALRDFKTWYDRLDAAKEEEDVEKTYTNHRLALWDADERCDDLLTYWLAQHQKNPQEESLYSTIARNYEKCGRVDKAEEWFQKRVDDFPSSFRAVHSLAIRRFEPLWPDPNSGEQYNINLSGEERIRIANQVIELLDKATEIDKKFRDAYTWRSMAYTQRSLARAYAPEEEEQTLEDKLNRILAREDSMMAWKQQKAVCDIDQLPECEQGKELEGQCCMLPPPPLTVEEQVADSEMKQELLKQLKEQQDSADKPQGKKKQR